MRGGGKRRQERAAGGTRSASAGGSGGRGGGAHAHTPGDRPTADARRSAPAVPLQVAVGKRAEHAHAPTRVARGRRCGNGGGARSSVSAAERPPPPRICTWGGERGTLCGRRTAAAGAHAHARRARACARCWRRQQQGARDGARDASEEGPRASMNRQRSRHPRPRSSGRLTRGHSSPTPPAAVQATPPTPPPKQRPSVRWCAVGGQRTQTDDGPPPARGGCGVERARGALSRFLASRHARGARRWRLGVARGSRREAL